MDSQKTNLYRIEHGAPIWVEVLLGLILFSLPISSTLNTVCLMILFAACLLFRLKSREWQSIKYYWPCLLLYGIQTIGYLTSEDLDEASKKLLLFTAFFTLSFLPIKAQIRTDRVFLYLAAGTLLTAVYGILRSLLDIVFHGVRYDYGYGPELLLQYLPHHAYFSMYLLSSVLVIGRLVGTKKLSSKWLLALPGLYMTLFLLPSRTTIFLGMSIVPLALFQFLSLRYAIKKLLAIGGVTLMIILLTGLSIDFTRDKLVYAYKELVSRETEDKPFYGISNRKMIWESSIQVAVDNGFLGTGIGDFQTALDKKYLENGYKVVYGKNAHNQYLQNLIQYGVILTLLYFIVIVWLLWQLFRIKHWFLLYHWILVFSLFFTESIMNRQWGVLFVAVLLALSVTHLHTFENQYQSSILTKKQAG